MTNDERFERLEQKIELLEKELASHKLTPDEVFHGEIKASGYTMVNACGKTMAKLAVYNNTAVFVMYDNNGKERAGLSVSDHSPCLWLFDSNGKERATFSVFGDEARLSMLDSNGNVIWEAP